MNTPTRPEKHPTIAPAKTPAGGKSDEKQVERAASPWDAIAVGSKVLAKSTEPGEDGYYLSTVEEISADKKTLTLKWVGYPKLPPFKVRRLAVGIIAVVK